MNGFINRCSRSALRERPSQGSYLLREIHRAPGLVSAGEKVGPAGRIGWQLLAGIEFKSQVGSFGNNYNNRTEEAIGSATDIWAAYREGAFKPSARPWLGYLMLLEEAPRSSPPVRAREPHFKVFPEFKEASYAKRYEILLTKLVRERLYDSACFLLSDSERPERKIQEPAAELNFEKFMASLLGRAVSVAKTRK